MAATIAGASAVSSAEASTERADGDAHRAHSRWGIAQGAARYGLAPSPVARPREQQVLVRLVGAPATNGALDPAIARRIFLMNGPRFRACGERTVVAFGDVSLLAGTSVTAEVNVSPTGAIASRPTIVVQGMNRRIQPARAELTNCLGRMFSAIRFPTNEGATQSYAIQYRFAYVVP